MVALILKSSLSKLNALYSFVLARDVEHSSQEKILMQFKSNYIVTALCGMGYDQAGRGRSAPLLLSVYIPAPGSATLICSKKCTKIRFVRLQSVVVILSVCMKK